MSRLESKKKCGWSEIIAEAEGLLKKVTNERKLKMLRLVIDSAKESLDAGEPWPGDERAEMAKEAIPA